jgi:DNA-binding MarR family transcriptional regulator
MADRRQSGQVRADDVDVDVEALMLASRVLTAVVARSLAGIQPPVSLVQLRTLAMIATHGTMNLTSVAEGLDVNASNASRTCDRLVRDGLLRRREDTEDRRSIQLSLTPRGQRLVERVFARRRSVLEQVVARMSQTQQRQLTTSLRAFVDAAAKASAEGDLSDAEGHLLRWLV